MHARRNILIAFAVCVALMGLVPPYEAAYVDDERTREVFIRYDLIANAPSGAEGYEALFGTEGEGPPPELVRVRIDAQRLFTQVVALGIVVVALYLMVPGSKRRRA